MVSEVEISRPKNLIFKGVTVALATLLALVAAEGGLRLWRDLVLEKNAGGAISPGDKVIVSLGESTTFGLYVPEHETYSRVLEGLLNARADGRRYRVVNLGWPAAISADIRRCFESAIDIYEPSLVIANLGHNDFSYQMNYWARGSPPPGYLRDKPLTFGEEGRPRGRGGLLLLRVMTRWYREGLIRAYGWRRAHKPWDAVADRRGNRRLVFENSGAETPEQWDENKPAIRRELRNNLESMFRRSREGALPLVLVGYLDSPANETLAAFAESELVPFVDNEVEALIDRNSYVIGKQPGGQPDLFHPNISGHRLIAANIFETLERRGLLRGEVQKEH